MYLDFSKLDNNKDDISLIFHDMQNSNISLGFSRTGYIRFDISNDDKFPPWNHMGTEMRPCFSFDLDTAKSLMLLLKSYFNREEIYYDAITDIYDTDLFFYRSNLTLLIMPTFNSSHGHNKHWNHNYIKISMDDIPSIIQKLEELINHSNNKEMNGAS